MSGFSTVKNNNQMGSVALQAAQNAVSKATIGMLRNVDAVAADDNNALLYNSSNEKWEAKSLTSIPTVVPQNIADLKNVSTTAPTNGQVLKYISGTGLWTPGTTGTPGTPGTPGTTGSTGTPGTTGTTGTTSALLVYYWYSWNYWHYWYYWYYW